DFTSFEAGVRRYFVPFYSWIRNNAGFQVRQLLSNPKSIALAPKLHEAMEEAFAGESRVPRSMRPRWMLDALAIQVSTDPESRSAVMGINTLPMGDAIALLSPLAAGPGEGVQGVLKHFASGLNPVIRAPLEIGAGREFFSGRDIGPNELSGDLSLGQHLTGQFRPVREVKAIERAGERGASAVAGRFLLGGRFQEFTDERLARQRLRELQEREKQLRSAFRRAESSGNVATSQRARVELMAVYAEMRRAGFEEDVPNWAASQLDAMEAAQVNAP
ncbi:MAG TPA: hypothetical protein VEC14_02600, partial [Reyranellaceae bacterium]|nr:hypothetical protein [Reyranellaceae bacterium]